MTKYNIAFEAKVTVNARSRDEAITKARAEVAKYPIKLDTTFVEKA